MTIIITLLLILFPVKSRSAQLTPLEAHEVKTFLSDNEIGICLKVKPPIRVSCSSFEIPPIVSQDVKKRQSNSDIHQMAERVWNAVVDEEEGKKTRQSGELPLGACFTIKQNCLEGFSSASRRELLRHFSVRKISAYELLREKKQLSLKENRKVKDTLTQEEISVRSKELNLP